MRRARAEVQQKPASIGRFRSESISSAYSQRRGQGVDREGTWASCGWIGKGPVRILLSWKKANATAFPQWRRPRGRTKESACLRRVQFGAVQFVDGVAASSVDYVAVLEHGGGVAGARVAHAAGRGPGAGGWVIEFGAGKWRLRG